MLLVKQKENAFVFQFSKTKTQLDVLFKIEKDFIITFLDFNISNF